MIQSLELPSCSLTFPTKAVVFPALVPSWYQADPQYFFNESKHIEHISVGHRKGLQLGMAATLAFCALGIEPST